MVGVLLLLPLLSAALSRSSAGPISAAVTGQKNFARPLFGPPTTKLAFARHLHDSNHYEPLGHQASLRSEDAWKADGTVDPGISNEVAHGPEDTEQAYTVAKLKPQQGLMPENRQQVTQSGSEGDMGAGAVQEGWHRAGSNGVARHQNDVLNRWRPPKATESSEHEGRPLVYIYELPAPLLNCSWWNGWATYIYGAEVRVPEVSFRLQVVPCSSWVMHPSLASHLLSQCAVSTWNPVGLNKCKQTLTLEHIGHGLQVMSGSQFATDDPLKADLFLVPALLYCNDLEHNFPSGKSCLVLSAMQQGPYMLVFESLSTTDSLPNKQMPR